MIIAISKTIKTTTIRKKKLTQYPADPRNLLQLVENVAIVF